MVRYEVSINDKTYAAEAVKYSSQEAEFRINSTPYLVKLHKPIDAPGLARPDSNRIIQPEKAVQLVTPLIRRSTVLEAASATVEKATDPPYIQCFDPHRGQNLLEKIIKSFFFRFRTNLNPPRKQGFRND